MGRRSRSSAKRPTGSESRKADASTPIRAHARGSREGKKEARRGMHARLSLRKRGKGKAEPLQNPHARNPRAVLLNPKQGIFYLTSNHSGFRPTVDTVPSAGGGGSLKGALTRVPTTSSRYQAWGNKHLLRTAGRSTRFLGRPANGELLKTEKPDNRGRKHLLFRQGKGDCGKKENRTKA